LPIELEPALFLNEGNEHQAVEKALREEPPSFRLFGYSFDGLFNLTKNPRVFPEEFNRNRFNIGGFVVPGLNVERREAEQVRADSGKVK
jgi:hypothetical protein